MFYFKEERERGRAGREAGRAAERGERDGGERWGRGDVRSGSSLHGVTL